MSGVSRVTTPLNREKARCGWPLSTLTPRSARRRRIAADVEQAGSDLAEGVLDSLTSRNPGPAGKLRALLVKLGLVSIESVLNLAEGDAHPDNGALADAASAAVLTDPSQRVAALDDSDLDKAQLAAYTMEKTVLRQVTDLLKAMRSAGMLTSTRPATLLRCGTLFVPSPHQRSLTQHE